MSQLPAPQGIKLYYFGTQLDVGDQDTYLTAIMIAKGEPQNTRIRINKAEMLRLMGKKKSGAAFNWLAMSFRRIATGQLFYDTPTKEGSTPLLGPLEYDKETEEYYFIIPDAYLRVFGFNDFGYVDMEKRRLLGVDLAKWLQCYAVSHAKGEHKISVENLMEWSGFEGRERQFRGRPAPAWWLRLPGPGGPIQAPAAFAAPPFGGKRPPAKRSLRSKTPSAASRARYAWPAGRNRQAGAPPATRDQAGSFSEKGNPSLADSFGLPASPQLGREDQKPSNRPFERYSVIKAKLP